MVIERIRDGFSVCRVRRFSVEDLEQEFCFLAKTDREHSLVCRTEYVPADALEREDGWRAFRIKGVLAFSMIGVLSRISTLLAENGIGIFVVSTYQTDYVFTKEAQFSRALDTLAKAGYTIE